MQEFAGRVAVVTGAASGIGRALAERFAGLGMKLALADVEGEALEGVRAALAADGAEVRAFETDVARPESVQELARRTLEAFGRVHVVCNNAGVITGGLSWEAPLSDFEWVMGVNFWGVLHGVQTFVPILLDQGEEAHVVNTASMAALTTLPFASAYHVSKHAVLALSECLHHELAARGAPVKVSVVCPEGVSTRIHEAERNRPPSLRPPPDAKPSPEAEAVAGGLAQLVESGIPPQAIADRTIEAIRAERFYVLPEGEWREGCNRRLEDVRLARNPSLWAPAT